MSELGGPWRDLAWVAAAVALVAAQVVGFLLWAVVFAGPGPEAAKDQAGRVLFVLAVQLALTATAAAAAQRVFRRTGGLARLLLVAVVSAVVPAVCAAISWALGRIPTVGVF